MHTKMLNVIISQIPGRGGSGNETSEICTKPSFHGDKHFSNTSTPTFNILAMEPQRVRKINV